MRWPGPRKAVPCWSRRVATKLDCSGLFIEQSSEKYPRSPFGQKGKGVNGDSPDDSRTY